MPDQPYPYVSGFDREENRCVVKRGGCVDRLPRIPQGNAFSRASSSHEELRREPTKAVPLENRAFVPLMVFAHYHT
jgi:hypothetical protein